MDQILQYLLGEGGLTLNESILSVFDQVTFCACDVVNLTNDNYLISNHYRWIGTEQIMIHLLNFHYLPISVPDRTDQTNLQMDSALYTVVKNIQNLGCVCSVYQA